MLLKSSINSLDPAKTQWLSGYLAGRLAEAEQTTPAAQTNSQSEALLTILYGSETGNGEIIAATLAASAQAEGFNVKLQSLDNFRPANLRKLKHVAFVMSTHGEGDPPEEAVDLFAYLERERAPKLSDLNFRVLALGDRSYELFCEAGRKLEQRLQELGARPFGERVECDVDYHASANSWSAEIITYARDIIAPEKLAEESSTTAATHLSVVPSQLRWSRQQPFVAEVRRVRPITDPASSKDIFHLELSLEGSALRYLPGDALGVWAPNDPVLVSQILDRLEIKPSERVVLNDQEVSISQAMTEHLEITRLTTDTVRAFAAAGGQKELEARFSGFEADRQREFIEQRQLADLADEYPARIEAQALVDLLRPLSPRSYSIASSQQLVDEEVHLTVATLHSDALGTPRQGVASSFLNQRLDAGDQVRVFIEPNRRFRLPDDPATPIIMIAAGTGIAPYRAFMQEIESQNNKHGASRDSWLIYGNPHLRTDFLYQKEWLRWRETGLLNHIDTAWSRDGAEKHYVQDVVREQVARLGRWLQRGAHIYLCGSLQMGQAVQQALQDSLAAERGLDAEAAAAFVAGLRRERRLQKDLY